MFIYFKFVYHEAELVLSFIISLHYCLGVQYNHWLLYLFDTWIHSDPKGFLSKEIMHLYIFFERFIMIWAELYSLNENICHKKSICMSRSLLRNHQKISHSSITGKNFIMDKRGNMVIVSWKILEQRENRKNFGMAKAG